MIASLPMYWRPENAALWQAFWAHVQAADPSLPDLTPPEDIPAPWSDHWLREDLILSATCSLPFRTVLKDRVTYVGTLSQGTSETPGHYRSVLIRRPGVDTPRTLAFNEPLSHSGWAVTEGHPDLAQIDKVIETGAHSASLAAVAEGRADAAMIDAGTLRMLQVFVPEQVARVEIIGESASTPAHAIITAKGNDPAPLRAAMELATRSFRTDAPAQMGGPLSFHVLRESDYFDLPIPKAPAL